MQLYCVIKSNSGSYYWGPLQVQILKMALQGSETPKCFKFGQQHFLPRKGKKICKGKKKEKGKKIKIQTKSLLTLSSYLLLSWTVKKQREGKNQIKDRIPTTPNYEINQTGQEGMKQRNVMFSKSNSPVCTQLQYSRRKRVYWWTMQAESLQQKHTTQAR